MFDVKGGLKAKEMPSRLGNSMSSRLVLADEVLMIETRRLWQVLQR